MGGQDGGAERAERAERAAHTARAAGSLAARALARLPALTDELVCTIEEQNPGYRAMPVVPHEDLWRSCHDNLSRVLQLIASGAVNGSAAHVDERYDAARDTGHRRAAQGLPLDDVLRSYRLGGRLVWEALIDQANADDLVDTDGLLDLATRVWEVVDTISAQVAAAYHATEGTLLRTDAQRMAALWEGLLHGRAKDPAFAHEVARILGVPVAGPCAIVVADAGTGGNTAHLERRLAARDIVSVWQLRADSLVGLLALRPPAPGRMLAARMLAALREAMLAALREALTCRAGVSPVVSGLAEVDAAYRQAVLARRTVPAGRAEVAALAERLPDALLLSSPELGRQLVDRWLGDLLEIPPVERRLLLDTLQIWVSTGGSVKRTADAACCHRNTVLNRLQRLQVITGHDFADPGCLAEVALALRAATLLSGDARD